MQEKRMLSTEDSASAKENNAFYTLKRNLVKLTRFIVKFDSNVQPDFPVK